MMDIIGVCAAEVPVYLSYKLFHFRTLISFINGLEYVHASFYTISQKFPNHSPFYREKTKHLYYFPY